jgi:hypothetical protein
MATVFVLMQWETEWAEPIGVYSTEAAAEIAASEARVKLARYYREHGYTEAWVRGEVGDTFHVEEIEMDQIPIVEAI